jgi:hypothetical protein
MGYQFECGHTLLLRAAKTALCSPCSNVNEFAFTDRFETWAVQQRDDPRMVFKMKQRGATTSFFVIADVQMSAQEGTNQCSICHVTLIAGQTRVRCKSTQCHVVRNKQLNKHNRKADKSDTEGCLHLRILCKSEELKVSQTINNQSNYKTTLINCSIQTKFMQQNLPNVLPMMIEVKKIRLSMDFFRMEVAGK